MSSTSALRKGFPFLLAAALLIVGTRPVAAQDAEPDDPNPGALTVTAGIDFVNTYMFRGIRQDDTKIMTWPYLDIGAALWSADDGALRSVSLNLGIWNSLHPGAAGVEGPSGKLWYEGDFYGTLGLGFGGGVSLGTTYTAYTSPNNAFTTVKEIAVKLGVDDSAFLGTFALRPYALVALELDAAPGRGQADGGNAAGTYIELGVTPGVALRQVSLAMPLKIGLSGGDYYEMNTGTALAPVFVDSTFGFFSISGIATLPLGGQTRFGSWNVHGGVEYQGLGDTTTAINGKNSRVIGSFGFGVVY